LQELDFFCDGVTPVSWLAAAMRNGDDQNEVSFYRVKNAERKCVRKTTVHVLLDDPPASRLFYNPLNAGLNFARERCAETVRRDS